MHVCTGITESVASKYVILSFSLCLSLPFVLVIIQCTDRFMYFPLVLLTLTLAFCFLVCVYVIIIYNSYDLCPKTNLFVLLCFHLVFSFFSVFFFLSFNPSRNFFLEKRIKTDFFFFIVASPKRNEMPSFSSVHEFVP